MFLVVRTTLAKAVLACLALTAVTAGMFGIDATVGSQPAAKAADMSGFQAGNIIDDALFWDSNAMSVADIQSFLNAKVPTCAAGFTCLKSYSETTSTVAGTPMCTRYDGAPNESAATIIFKVAQTCGISPKVLLVVLQKEQGLVTHSAPSALRYRAAMGAGCPDTAACDSTYYGFFNQVHYGAFLLKRYTQPPGTGPGTPYPTRFDLRYPVGSTSAVLYFPNANCGAKQVAIQNQATHALYIYTPYTPNAAATATSYGLGDDCSTYGNRNFYSYYTDWFGSTRGAPVGVYFLSYYSANSSWLQYPRSAMTCASPDSGCVQTFYGGIVAGSFSTAAAGVRNDYAQQWGWYGRELAGLRYPTTEYRCDDMLDGCRQEFQGGWIVDFGDAAPTVLLHSIRQTWSWWGREYGTLGTPVSQRICADMSNACRQEFEGGWIVESASMPAPMVVPAPVLAVWNAYGREYNILGLPVGAPSADPASGNYTQAFAGGTITVTNNVGALTSASDPLTNAVVTSPWLGKATTAKSCTLKGGACYYGFENGWIVQAPTGFYAVPTLVVNLWGAYGREYNVLGFPSGAPSASPTSGNYTQAFQGGVITVSGGVAALTSSTDPVTNATVTSPWLGAATQAKSCTLKGGACYLGFANGWVVQSPAGVFAVPTAVVQLWGNYGREYNVLGFPSGAPSASPTSGNYTQRFQGGTVTVAGGVATVVVSDAMTDVVTASPWLGAVTQAKSCTLKAGACYTAFANGWVVQSPSGIYAVPTLVVNLWGNYGREYNVLGFPSGAPSASPTSGNYTQAFQGGVITVSGGVAALTSSTDPVTNATVTSPWLGAATQAKSCTLKGGACYLGFANGWVVQSPAGVFAVPTAVVQLWGNYGREYNVLGFPSGAPSASPTSGNYTQRFQGGTVTVAGGVATVVVSDAMTDVVTASPWLGAVTQAKSCTFKAGACYTAFANGWVVQSPSGIYAVPTLVVNLWGNYGREYNVLGFPSGAPSSSPTSGNYTQAFQGGVVTVASNSASVAF